MESVVGFSILTLVLAGFSGMAVVSLKNFRTSQERYVAAKIAQEGIELVTNKKDNHVQCVFGNPSCPISDWQTNLVDPISGRGDFEVESGDTTKLLVTGQFASFDPTRRICILNNPWKDRGKYGYCNGLGNGVEVVPGYTREVEIIRLSSYNILVRSTVLWRNQSLALETVLFGK